MIGPGNKDEETIGLARRFFGAFAYCKRGFELVWETSRRLSLMLAICALLAGAGPSAMAWIGGRIVDSAVNAIEGRSASDAPVFWWILVESLVVIVWIGAQHGINLCHALFRSKLGHRINVMILEKALTLDLRFFEDANFHDKLMRAQREATTRPMSLVTRTTSVFQSAVFIAMSAVLLAGFSPWAVLILVLGGMPAFVSQAKFAGEAFRLFQWRTASSRKQHYLEAALSREDHVKEIKLFDLGRLLLDRYIAIYREFYGDDRRITLRREIWGFALSVIGIVALYGAYVWVAFAALNGEISLGTMAMYLILFRQGQLAVTATLAAIAGMYEDNLYLSTLYEYLEQPFEPRTGVATSGPQPDAGVEFVDVAFAYPGSTQQVLKGINLQIRRGESLALVGANGSGKTTLIKLLTGLYEPTAGHVLVDGRDVREWDVTALRRRVGVIFQDFVRYHFTVGENLGAGDVREFTNEERWRRAAAQGNAATFVQELPEQYATQLGKSFHDGRELSGGQWQRIALSRAFMRTDADILVLDEPTAAMDAESEAEIFEHFRTMMAERIAIIISHRFSTVRMANQIVVLEDGCIVERGNHHSLMENQGIYAKLFTIQARGYQ